MMKSRKFVFAFTLAFLLAGLGCEKKKAHVPQKATAPTVAVVLPDEIPLTEVPEQEQVPPPKVEPPPAPPKTKPKKPARNTTATTAAKKSTPASTPATPPPSQQTPPANQTVASLHPPKAPGSEPVAETMIAAAVPNAQLTQLKEETTRMVEATENALKGITRNLNDEEKSMRSQIQSYLQQSRKATTDGDYERASLLAKKAQLLADALVKK
jgi:hypothetical protein